MRARAGMHHHPGGLVHSHDIGVFVQNVKRDVFGNRLERDEWSRSHLDVFAAMK